LKAHLRLVSFESFVNVWQHLHDTAMQIKSFLKHF
jgi:hypothetical protein